MPSRRLLLAIALCLSTSPASADPALPPAAEIVAARERARRRGFGSAFVGDGTDRQGWEQPHAHAAFVPASLRRREAFRALLRGTAERQGHGAAHLGLRRSRGDRRPVALPPRASQVASRRARRSRPRVSRHRFFVRGHEARDPAVAGRLSLEHGRRGDRRRPSLLRPRGEGGRRARRDGSGSPPRPGGRRCGTVDSPVGGILRCRRGSAEADTTARCRPDPGHLDGAADRGRGSRQRPPHVAAFPRRRLSRADSRGTLHRGRPRRGAP